MDYNQAATATPEELVREHREDWHRFTKATAIACAVIAAHLALFFALYAVL